MHIRKTRIEELDAVMSIYDIGRAYMRANGNMEQWDNGHPKRELITEDIKSGLSYIVADEDDSPIAVFAFIPGEDITYKKIYNGAWLNNEDYWVIHRIAVAQQKRNIAKFVYDWCSDKCTNIRIDTHRDNIPMQNSLKKNGFEYCGIIYLESGAERLAFQKIIHSTGENNNENT